MSTTTAVNRVRRALVADTDTASRQRMREVLEKAGFVVTEASDGREALQSCQNMIPDVILMEIDLPHVDGLSVCMKLRHNNKFKNTPICIVSRKDDDRSVRNAYEMGVTDFISKPVSRPVLEHRVCNLLSANDSLQEIKGLMLAMPDAAFVLDRQGEMRSQLTGVPGSQHSGVQSIKSAPFEDLFPERDSTRIQECIELALASSEPQIHEYTIDDGNVHLETRFVARDSRSVIAIVREVTERKKSESQIYNLAFYDRLTGLPNRQLFAQELERTIRLAKQQQREFTILFIDLDRFKRINDTLGHAMGDELLKAVAARLEESTRSADRLLHAEHEDYDDASIARLGGDEFVVILPDVGCQKTAASIASRVIKTLTRPFSCNGHQFVVTPSIGIAMYPQDGESNDDILTKADTAMYRAKANGRNNYKFCAGTMTARTLHRLDMELELQRAIEQEAFELHYQPKVDLSTWTVVGAEALLRWNHAERGWIPPSDFIPVAEETGLILPLGTWVLNAACQQLKRWHGTPLGDLGVSVNVSTQQIYADDLATTVTSAVTDAVIRPRNLELEITESLLMRDIEATIKTLNFLKEFGVRLSIDDFGTGYSSLSYLKRFPIDTLKIDRSFVKDLHRDPDDAAICAAILAMARNLDLKVVAEGVEVEEQLEFLRRHRCDQIQGFFFSKPLAVTDFEAFVSNHLGDVEHAAG